MKFTKNQKIAIGSVGALAIIIILGLVYAAFTQQLTINGSATGRSSSWRVYFSSLSNVSLTGTAKEITAPEIDSNNQTSIGDYEVTVTSPGDAVEYTFDVTNSGDYDATLTGLAKTNPSCSGTGANASTDATNVCGKLTYTLKYADGTTVAQNDTLKSKETKTMKLKLTYNTFDDDSLLPKADVAITGLGITLTYSQDGNAKVNNDGTTPWVDLYSHHVGDEITVAGEQYYVIANSPTIDDYVVALKANPLTVAEVTAAGGTANDIQGDGSIGGMSFHFSSGAYATSNVKSVVDAWAAAKFTNSELKTVDGYGARLIQFNELTTNLGYEYYEAGTNSGYRASSDTPSWVYNSEYWYWTMSPYNDSSNYVWGVLDYGQLGGRSVYTPVVYSPGEAVRPVINVYKSAIQSS